MVRFGVTTKAGVVAIALAVALMALAAHVAGASSPSSKNSLKPRTGTPAFLFDRGRFTPYDAPGARLETSATGINDHGQITGSVVDADGVYHGYLRDRRGRITGIDLPGAVATAPAGVNNRGQIVGRYYESAPIRGPDARFRGYLQDGRKLIRIDVPGALKTQAVDINNRGHVVGEYLDTDGVFHGFLWREGRFTTIDFPAAAGSSLTGINDRGEILGVHVDSTTGAVHGFLLKRGRFKSFDAPGAPITLPMDINNHGDIVGVTILDADLTGGRAFLLAKGVGGRFTPIDFPGAPRTVAFAINDRSAITGTYENTRATSIPPAGGEQPMGMSVGDKTL